MKRVVWIGLAAGVLAFAPASSQAYTIAFNFATQQGVVVDGAIRTANVANTNPANSYTVESIAGTVTIPSMPETETITGLVPDPNQPMPNNDGLWIYDNLVYGLSPFVDNPGVLFDARDPSGHIYDYNIYTIGAGPKVTWYLSSNNPHLDYNPGQMVVSGDAELISGRAALAPEPSTWAMMGLGFAGLALAGLWGRRGQRALA